MFQEARPAVAKGEGAKGLNFRVATRHYKILRIRSLNHISPLEPSRPSSALSSYGPARSSGEFTKWWA